MVRAVPRYRVVTINRSVPAGAFNFCPTTGTTLYLEPLTRRRAIATIRAIARADSTHGAVKVDDRTHSLTVNRGAFTFPQVSKNFLMHGS